MGRVYDEQEVILAMRDHRRAYALAWADRLESAAEVSDAGADTMTRVGDKDKATFFEGAAFAQRRAAEELRVAVIRDRADEEQDAA